MPFRGLTMLKSRKLVLRGGLCYRFAMVDSRLNFKIEWSTHRNTKTPIVLKMQWSLF